MMKPVLAAALLCCLFAATALAVEDTDTMTVNRWGIVMNNRGPFGNPGWWRMTDHTYLFGCGLWFGALDGIDTLVSLGYNPNTGGSEMTSGDSTGNGDDVRIYAWPDDWPPPAGRFPNAPQAHLSHGDRWTLFNDLTAARHINPGRPLGLQVWQTTYAWTYPWAHDFVYYLYELANVSSDTLHACYAGIVNDYDIGEATDDVYGAFYHRQFVRGPGDTLYIDHLAYGCNYGNVPGWDTTGALGMLLPQTPRSAGVSSIKRFTLDIDPTTDPQQYLTMAGYNYRTMEYEPIDTTDASPADKRFLLSCGPFDMAPGAVDTLVLALIGCPRWPADTLALAECAYAADSLYPLLLSGLAETPVQPAVSRLATFPNPSRGPITIRFGSSFDTRHSPLVLYDASGRLVLSRPFDIGNSSFVIDLAPGVYFASCGAERLKLVQE
jgi:hypothetical protein